METRIKVLALSYLFPNRIHPNHGIFVLNRLKALSKYVDIKVVNPIPWSPLHKYMERFNGYENIPRVDYIDELEIHHPRYFSIPRYFKAIEPVSYLRAITPVIKNISKSFDFDLVDMHWTFPDLPAGTAIAKKYNAKSMVTLRGLEALHLKENNSRERAVVSGLQEVDDIVALSGELLRYGQELSGNVDKGNVVINGVDTSSFGYIPADQARRSLNLSLHEKFIISVGSLIKRKGFDLLINSLAQLRTKPGLEGLKLYIIGSQGPEGDYRKQLFELVKSLKLEDAVVFVGQIQNSQLMLWYNAADIFCLSSRGEGSPNVLSEALACGCPAVSSDVGSARELINLSAGAGICVDTLSVESLTDSLSSLLLRETDRRMSSDNYSQFNWDWCAKNVLKIYKQCLSVST